MEQAAKLNPIETGTRTPAPRSEIAARIARHAHAVHGAKSAYVSNCAACCTLHAQLREARDEPMDLRPIKGKVRIPKCL
jgi:hypothetical protein